MKFSHLILASVAAVASLSCAAAPVDAQQIRSLISKTYDHPGAIVQTAPVVVVDNHAIAGWTQGARGGRALLRKSNEGQCRTQFLRFVH